MRELPHFLSHSPNALIGYFRFQIPRNESRLKRFLKRLLRIYLEVLDTFTERQSWTLPSPVNGMTMARRPTMEATTSNPLPRALI